MALRRLERAAAALLLTALCASFALLLHPIGPASAADSNGIDLASVVKVTYGCTDRSDTDGGPWVQVALDLTAEPDASDELRTFQIGYTFPAADPVNGPYTQGGPTQVVASSNSVTPVRLAGVVDDATGVFVRRVASNEVATFPLNSCDPKKTTPVNFQLDDPQLTVSNPSCGTDSRVHFQAQVHNPNDLNQDQTHLGLNEIDYTVLVVRTSDSQIMSNDASPAGELVRFWAPGHDTVPLAAPAATTTNYELRVVGVDGSSVSSRGMAVNCGRVSSAPPTTTPSPTPTATKPSPSTKPSTTPRPSASATPPGTGAGGTNGGQTDGNGGQAIGGGNDGPSAGTSAPSSSRSVEQVGNSRPPTSPTATSTPSQSQSARRLIASNPTSPQRIFIWQRDAALVVLVDIVAISGLVGATVWSAKRR